MPRLGIGFPAGRRRKRSSDSNVQLAAIQPSPQWNGTAGSGFSAAPTDPARTTAKPAIQLLVPPRQRFTDKIIVGVLAMANNTGSMVDTLGLNKVQVHFEGTVHDIIQPRVQRIADANGGERLYLGWWIELEHNGIHGEAQVYFEAVPKDSSMQNRVIGPYSFFQQPAFSTTKWRSPHPCR